MISPGVFFIFKILMLLVASGVKGQRMAQNDKKAWLSGTISQEPYFMWLSFMVHIHKIISLGAFFNFLKFLLSGLLGG